MHRRISSLVSRVQRRLEGEEGFTLIELTIVMLILGILLTIALPSYLSLQDNANKTAAKEDVAQALRAVIAYGNDNFPGSNADPDAAESTTDNGYTNIKVSYLETKYDASLAGLSTLVVDPNGWNGNSTSPTDFCITVTIGRWTAAQHGPGGKIEVGTNFTAGTCTAS